ncbi:MAG: YafY family transcriptional regulator [Silicimonas sp.]|jgi:predicted DNA-binding transcriptional regulator YafY|nr:YafY family transcriptional regulator [Silicimonas sp.]
MRRTDRLFELIQILRDGRLHRGQDMADRLGVSVRTLYRDMDTIIASGIPVEGERGLGYMMTAPITLPPLNLSLAELEALHLGLAVVSKAADEELQLAAQTLSEKVDAVLPEDRAAPASGWGFAVYPFAEAARGFVHMAPLRAAIRSRRKVDITYQAPDKDETRRTVRPLQMEYWGRVWTFTGWCELRNDFRVFRVDRIRTLDIGFETFDEEPGKTLADYLDRMQPVPEAKPT